jgi:hypothetical protein
MFCCLSVSPLLMSEWLTWTLVGVGAWLAVSVPVAFLAGHLLGREPAPRRRTANLPRPTTARPRMRDGQRTLTRLG